MPYIRSTHILRLALATLLLLALAAPLHADDARRVLFIRGADRSGGFLEANSDAGRTEQLADIQNASTANRNHGWKQLADLLRGEGFTVEQMTETVEPGNTSGQSEGRPVPFDTMELDRYRVIVFGSNNARYTPAQVDAVDAYVRGGGGAIFISDANFGSDWADASDSDQPFLDRFGLTVNQDRGTYSLTRDDGEFRDPDHPILAGVDRFDGEGVTPITVNENLPAGVDVTILARAEGQVRRNQPPFGNRNAGPSTPAGPNDAALLAATVGLGRIVGHFDRNTFFNTNGAGTDLTRFDNAQLAANLFEWAAVPEPATAALLAPAALLLIHRRRR